MRTNGTDDAVGHKQAPGRPKKSGYLDAGSEHPSFCPARSMLEIRQHRAFHLPQSSFAYAEGTALSLAIKQTPTEIEADACTSVSGVESKPTICDCLLTDDGDQSTSIPLVNT